MKQSGFTITEENGIFVAKANNPNYRSTFNATNDSIEWAKWTWNPVTGCKFNCPYCYAKDMAENEYYASGFPKKFEPTFHPDRLKAPFNTKIPAARANEEGINNVFVCSMADLFGDWIPSDIIKKVFDVCGQTPQFNYLFLTKNPDRYLSFFEEQPDDYVFPLNCWLGATADTDARFQRAIKAFAKLKQYVDNTIFLSCEPLLEPFNLSSIPDVMEEDQTAFPIDWVIIGGLKGSENSDRQPEWSWVEDILRVSRNYNVDVYFKPNLTVRPKEYPQT